MRLEPIENPKSFLLKTAYRISKRRFGKVLMPMKVVYARKTPLLAFAMKIGQFEDSQTSLAPELRILIKTATATLNGCTFCQDIALAQAVKRQIGVEKFAALLEDNANLFAFTEPERAVLVVIREYNTSKRVSDQAFAALKKHFNDTQIVEIFALNAFEHFYNALMIPLAIESDGLQRIAESKTKSSQGSR